MTFLNLDVWIVKFVLFQDSRPHLSWLSLLGPGQSRSCVAVFHWLAVSCFFYPINIWQRHLSRLFVISHTNDRVSCLLDKTWLILSCQKLWISQKGKITSAGMRLLCLMEKVTAIICCFMLSKLEKLQVRKISSCSSRLHVCTHCLYPWKADSARLNIFK